MAQIVPVDVAHLKESIRRATQMDLLPRIHMVADLSKENDEVH